MPTLKLLVGKEKEDKTFPVMIQLYHQRQKKYIATGHFVVKRQITTRGILKDQFVIDALTETIKGYRQKLLKIPDINNCSIEYLKNYLLQDEKKQEIDFIAFGRTFIESQSITTGRNTLTVLNALVDFLGRDTLPVDQMNLKLLNAFAAYLRTERTATRINERGKEVKHHLQPISDTAVKDYIGKLRQIFIAAQDEYNDEDTGTIQITHYPFRKFKMPRVVTAKKRNLKASAIRLIRDTPDLSRRADLGRDVFMLSFYLVGANLADLFAMNGYKNGRISYNRLKTSSRKADKAFISIKVEPEAEKLIQKYKDPTGKRVFNFYRLYSDQDNFVKAVNLGLKNVCEYHNKEKVQIQENVSSYYARGSWSTIARNDCRIPKDDIHFALNHSDPSMKVTDLYIEEDFSIIDRANRKVIDLIFKQKGR